MSTKQAKGANKVSDETNAVSPTRIEDAIRVYDAMVMKAAKSLCKQHAKRKEVCPKLYWREYSEYLIADAQVALTECGALECLEALRACEVLFAPVARDATAKNAIDAAHAAIAKVAAVEVYGSAPE